MADEKKKRVRVAIEKFLEAYYNAVNDGQFADLDLFVEVEIEDEVEVEV